MTPLRSWIPTNEPVVIAGHRIAGGLFYVGRALRSTAGGAEPAQINPALPVDPAPADRAVHDLGPAPSYHLISAGHRAAYLAWLARGRAGADVPVGLVRLFFSGLERRVLVDAATDPAARDEFPAIAAEAHRLADRYGPAHPSFGQQARSLLDVLDLLTAPARWPGGVAAPVATGEPRWPVPLTVRIALAQLANAGRPVPPEWARCWAWFHPSLFPATPQTRCPEEFSRLFGLRYRRRLPAGFVPVAAGRPPVRIGYQPVNPGMDTVVVERPDLPDVLEEPAATRQLGALDDEVTRALTPYSRWLARNPGGRHSVASTVLLPDDLLDHEPGPLRPLMSWAGHRLDGAPQAVIDGSEFAPFWSTADPRGMSRDEAASLAVVLSRIGLGVEPDARFAGPPLGPGPAVLFRLDPQTPDSRTTQQPSAGYRAACLLLAVAGATLLAAGDRPADDATVNRTVTALAAEIRLTVEERTRLAARLRWLLAGEPDPAQLRRRAEALSPAERDSGAHFLLRLATESAPLRPAAVVALTSAYRLLALPAGELYRGLHDALAEDQLPGSPRRPTVPGPVLVRRGRPAGGGHELPWAATRAKAAKGGEIPLRRAVIDQRIAETAAVTALLAEIFTEQADELAADHSVQRRELGGLDAEHRAILAQLAARPTWSGSEFAGLAARHGVLPAGALDVINEAAIEITGQPAIEGDDLLGVDDAVVRELLA